LSELLAALGRGPHLASAAEAFERLAQEVDGFEGMRYSALGFGGQVVPRNAAAGVRA
jgi:hypothetical protein